jgi:hypothetical protein
MLPFILLYPRTIGAVRTVPRRANIATHFAQPAFITCSFGSLPAVIPRGWRFPIHVDCLRAGPAAGCNKLPIGTHSETGHRR